MLTWLFGKVLNPGDPTPSSSASATAAHLLRAWRGIEGPFTSHSSGRVDYARLAASPAYAQAKGAAMALHTVDPAKLNQADRLAFWLNVYNAMVIQAIIDTRAGGRTWPYAGCFRRTAYRIGEWATSLDEIEHGLLRGNRLGKVHPFGLLLPWDARRAWRVSPSDPRVHFALNCGAASCPPIRFYEGVRIDEQLDQAAQGFINGPAVVIDPEIRTLSLSQLFRWYVRDFGGRDGIRSLLTRHLTDSDAKQALLADWDAYRWVYLPYDWGSTEP